MKPRKPYPQPWYPIAIGRSGFSLNEVANSRDRRLGAELYISSEEAKRHFANLHAQREQIEAQLGYEPDWQELPDAKAVWRPDSTLEEEDRWPEYLDWLTQRILEMHRVFQPQVRALP
ncbi:MAG: DUF4268 domain-containing protein [Armatimonadetes bacterium]|nr:DUF4268 domain-containing protein [Armatimonadota bacterium]